MSPTEAGKRFFEKARRIIAETESALEEIKSIDEDVLGILRLHMTPGTGRTMALPIVYDFMRDYPLLKVEIEVKASAVDILNDGFDISIRSGGGEYDTYLKYPASVASVKLAAAEYRICASPAYLQRSGQLASPHELVHHRCLVYAVQPNPKVWWFRDGERRFCVEVDGHMLANDWSVIYDAAVAGLGIARVIAPSITGDRLVPVLSEYVEADRGVWAFYPRMQPLPRKTQLLLSYLEDRLKSPR